MLQLSDPPINEKAWSRFLEIGLPTRTSEVYRYVRLKDLYSSSFSLPKPHPIAKEQEEATLVFVNGSYCPALSCVPSPIIALPLSSAFKTYGSFLNQRLQKQLKEEKDPFVLLNSAYLSEGLFLYLPPKSVCDTPLKIVHLLDTLHTPTLLSPKIHLFAGKEAMVSLCFSQKITQADVWTNSVIDMVLEEGASVNYSSLSHLHEACHETSALRVTLKSHSHFKSYAFTKGSKTSRQDFAIRLAGSYADASLCGLWNVDGARQHHVNVEMVHEQPFCNSLQKFKGILGGQARSSFEGKIYVHAAAQKTEAFQINNNLLLSEGASAYSKPNLEIFADDVKASHGTTMGQLKKEDLFYLKTRGVPLELAKKLLIQGFGLEIIDKITDQKIREEALEVIA